MTLPKDDLVRMVELPSAELRFDRADDAEDGRIGTLYGYAAVFNTDTVINSWEGHFIERIAPGAFSKTLKERSDKVKVLFNHGFDPTIGDKPLGKATVMEERSKGLWVEVPLDDTSYNRDLVASLRSGALDGMSFRFAVVRDEEDKSGDVPVRTLREVKLYEFGPVTFPAYEATTVGVRSRADFLAFRQGNISADSDATLGQGTSDDATGTPPNEVPTSSKRAHKARLSVALIDLDSVLNN